MAISQHVRPPVVPAVTRFRRIQAEPGKPSAPGLRIMLGIWAVLGVLTLAVLVTYSRFPASTFYHVSESGLEGGLGRALVFINYPVSIIGIALMGFAVARLYASPGALTATGRAVVGAIAVLATGMSFATALVVRQSDLDAKPGNIIPAVGVALALGITLFAVRKTGAGVAQPWSRGDMVRLASIGLLSIAALPWILAIIGVYIADIPLLGRLYMSGDVVTGEDLSVHLGDHHGFDGYLFAIAAIMLTRELGRLSGPLRLPLSFFVGLMLVYGVANAVQDFWGEQLIKRGWVETEMPSMVMPALSTGWGLILLGAVVVTALLLTMNRPTSADRMQPVTG